MAILRRFLGLLLAALSGFLPPACVLEASSELTAIETTLADYLEGGMNGDLERLERAFHPRARLQFVRDGTYQEWTLQEYLNGRISGHRSDHQARILAIDFTGTSATAKLELDHGDHRFIDYMSLLRVDGQWRIVNKVFYRADG